MCLIHIPGIKSVSSSANLRRSKLALHKIKINDPLGRDAAGGRGGEDVDVCGR